MTPWEPWNYQASYTVAVLRPASCWRTWEKMNTRVAEATIRKRDLFFKGTKLITKTKMEPDIVILNKIIENIIKILYF